MLGDVDQVNIDKVDDDNRVDISRPSDTPVTSRNPRVKVDVAVKFGSKWHKKKVSGIFLWNVMKDY